MRILIDINHPAHFHNYKYLSKELIEKGHKVFWTVKNIPSAVTLLRNSNFDIKVLPRKRYGIFSKIVFQIIYDFLILVYCLKNKIEIAVGTSVSIAHVSKITGIKSIVLDDDDDDVQPLMRDYVHPFAGSLLSPDCLKYKRKRNDTIYYPGYHELAYLHPKRFVPDPSILKEADVNEGEIYFVLRFNTFKAHHDSGAIGISKEQKLIIINTLKGFGRIFITTEGEIEPELEQYKLKTDPGKIHSLLYYAHLFIGDSQTMTTEAALLGIPALKCNSFAGRLSVPNELEGKYKLCYSFLPENFDKMVERLKEMLNASDLKEEWVKRKNRMLVDKIDVTSFLVWFIERYPESVDLVKEPGIFEKNFR